MTLDTINRTLLENVISDQHKAGEKFFEYAQTIDSLCSNPQKLYSRIDFPSQESEYNSFIQQVYISSIFSDVSKIYPTSGFATYFGDERYDEQEINELLEHHKIITNSKEILSVREGYFIFSDSEADFLQTNLNPLFDAGLITLTPNPNLMIIAGSKEEPNFYTVPAEVNFETDMWRAPLYSGKQKDIPIKQLTTSNPKQAEIIQEIMIPFISGLSAKDFSLVLQDEGDLISSFRYELKKLTDIKNNNYEYSSELYQDLIRPRIDRINQKFKSISELHSFKMKGVTAFTSILSLVSLAAGDFMGAASIIVGLGTGTAGVVKFEADYHSEVNNLKNDSMYLLWRLNQIRKA